MALLLCIFVLAAPAGTLGGGLGVYRIPRRTRVPVNIPRRTAAPIVTPPRAPQEGTAAGTDEPAPAETPAPAAVLFPFGYVNVNAGVPGYADETDREPAGVFAENGSAYAAASSGERVKLVFVNTRTAAVTEVFVSPADVAGMPAADAAAFRAMLSAYDPVYYQGVPLPAVAFDPAGEPAQEAADPPAEEPARPEEGEDAQETIAEQEHMPAAAPDGEDPEQAGDAAAEPVPWQTAPDEVTAEVTGNCQALISWRGNGTAKQYAVYEIGWDGKAAYIGHVEDAESFITPQLPDGEHTFIVRPRAVVDGFAVSGDASGPVTVRVEAVYWTTAVTDVDAQVVGRNVTVTWTGNGIADQYSVYMAGPDGVLAFAGKTENGETVFRVENLPDGEYRFLIRSRLPEDGMVRTGEPSESVTVSVPAIIWSTAVTGLAAAVSEDGREEITLTWTGNGKTDQYEVLELLDGQELSAGRAERPDSHVIRDASGGIHQYIVRSWRTEGGETELGEASAPVTVDLSERWKTAPRNVRAVSEGQNITLTWEGSRLTPGWMIYEITGDTLNPVPVLSTSGCQALIPGTQEGPHSYCIYPASGTDDAEELGEPSGEIFIVAGDYQAYGRTDRGLVWALARDGLLSVSGSGPMDDYSEELLPPWSEYEEDITAVTVAEGVTTVGSYAFQGCTLLQAADLPQSLTEIGDSAFRDCESLTAVRLPDGIVRMGDFAFYGCPLLARIITF